MVQQLYNRLQKKYTYLELIKSRIHLFLKFLPNTWPKIHSITSDKIKNETCYILDWHVLLSWVRSNPVGHTQLYPWGLGKHKWLQPPLLWPQRFEGWSVERIVKFIYYLGCFNFYLDFLQLWSLKNKTYMQL